MNQNTAPAGALGVIGHPANNIRIVKVGERWRYVHSGDLVDPEDFRAGWNTDLIAHMARVHRVTEFFATYARTHA